MRFYVFSAGYFETFGSVTNGLGTINSDLDLSIHLQNERKQEMHTIDPGQAQKILKKMSHEMKRKSKFFYCTFLELLKVVCKMKNKTNCIYQ